MFRHVFLTRLRVVQKFPKDVRLPTDPFQSLAQNLAEFRSSVDNKVYRYVLCFAVVLMLIVSTRAG